MSLTTKNQLTLSNPRTIQMTAITAIEIEAAADGGAGNLLPRFQMLAYTGTPMRVSGWRHPVILDLAGLSIPSQSRPIRFGHDAMAGVGHTDSIRVEKGQLVASGVVSRDTAAAREVVASSKNGFPWQASVGASVEEFEFVKEHQQVTVNGKQHQGPLNVVRRSTLGEISFVDLGADGATSASVAATHVDDDHDDDALDAQTDDAQVVSSGASSPSGSSAALCTPMPGASATEAVSRIRAQAAAEIERIDGIRRLCNGRHARIEAQAIRDGWDVQRTELQILRDNRPAAPAVHVPEQIMTDDLLVAACLKTGKYEALEAVVPQRTLELADKRFRGGLTFHELIMEAAWANGYTERSFRDKRAAMEFAFGQHIKAGFSTVDLAGILSNVANKFLLQGFFSVEGVWRSLCSVRSVKDFKTVTSYRMIGKQEYEKVAPGGEIKHGTLGNEQFTNKANTYGLMLNIDRTMLFNDDLDAISTVPFGLGRGSGLAINNVFWTAFMNNGSFFTVGNKNYSAGADTALTIDGLSKAEVAFMDQVDSDGKPTGIMPSILLVPTALSAMATQLYKSLEIRDTTANTKAPIGNPHQGKFRVEVSRYLANALFPGNSSRAWYLLADPNDLPVIEVAFLNGQESPTIETADADFKELAIQMRGYHDFGVALQDPRGGVKMKGEV
jgi:hypothetical protein